MGHDMTMLRVGDRVLATAETGGYAEAVAVAGRAVPPSAPGHVVCAGGVARRRLRHVLGGVAPPRAAQPGETVLVLGAAGGIGHASVQLAKAMGARVLGGISRPEREKLARAAGADAIIDLSRPNLRDSLREQVYAETDGRGVDVIIDPLGGDMFTAAIRALAWGGRLVVIGFAAGGIPTLRTNYLLVKNIEISGLQITDYRYRRPAELVACYAELFDFYESGLVEPAPATIFALDQAGEALTAVRERRINGRAVLRLRDL